MSARMTLSDLPPAYQKQAAEQLSPRGDATTAGTTTAGTARRAAPASHGAAQAGGLAKKAGPRLRHGPNKTEAAFRDWLFSHHLILAAHEVHYEALTFRLPGGSRYTPDWVLFIHSPLPFVGEVICFEVKGSCRLGSHGRALTAFREARAAFPTVKFCWFEKNGGTFVGKYKEERE
jgi:hypothetical protein